jgi:hypothetical protein
MQIYLVKSKKVMFSPSPLPSPPQAGERVKNVVIAVVAVVQELFTAQFLSPKV